MSRIARRLGSVLVALVLSYGCAGTVYVRKAPPPARVEVKPARPGPRAVWIDGHWKWARGRYVWVAGHWVRKPKGQWVPGHWQRRPRGYVWVRGHWKR